MTSTDVDSNTGGKRLGLVAILIAIVVLVIVALIVLLADDGDDEVVGSGETTTTTGVVDTATAVFPSASDDTRFDDPLDAAVAWAERVVGFVDPVYSEFRQGDSRSGEVEVRPSEGGPATTILLRQLDDTWWVLGSVAETIAVSEPGALDDLSSPLLLRGEASAPQGTLSVELWTDAADQPLAMATPAADTDELAPFEATLEWEQPPQTRSGALYVRSRDADTGAVHGATVLRVHFGG